MHGFKTGEITLRVNNRTFLRIVFMKLSIQFGIPSLFITITPPNNRRMIHVTFYHAFNQTYSGGGIILAMPASQFVHHIKSERITGFQKFRVSRIMAQTDRIHIHAFHQKNIFYILLFTQRTATFRTETMAIDTTYIDTYSVYIKSVAFAYFNRAETKIFRFTMQNLTSLIQ